MLILLFFLFYSLFIYRLHFNPTPPPSPTRMTFPPFVPRAAQADRDCVSHSERSSSSAHLQKSSFSRRVSPPGSSPSSQSSRWRLWHSITPLVPVVTKVPNRGVIGHSSLSYDWLSGARSPERAAPVKWDAQHIWQQSRQPRNRPCSLRRRPVWQVQTGLRAAASGWATLRTLANSRRA